MSSYTPKYNPQPSKRRKISHTDEVVNLLGPSRGRVSAVLPQRRPRVSDATAMGPTSTGPPPLKKATPIKSQDSETHENKVTPKPPVVTATATAPKPNPKPLPKLVDSPLTSENIESALNLIDRNTRKKNVSFDKMLQVFHDLYRWSRLPNKDHRKFFMDEFVWEYSGISRVSKFLKKYEMGDEFLRQLLQTELPFDE